MSPSLPCYTSAIGKDQQCFAGRFSLGNFQVTWFEGHRFPHRVKDRKGRFYRSVFVKYFAAILFSPHHSKVGCVKESGALGGTKAGWEYSSEWHHRQGQSLEPLALSLLPELREQLLI